ncbi:MAG: hypothetical protein M1831_004186 [Alyxoria varia]|nr:MAG: hypothetical protein M1831_004186 [Alyxoria varia]
MYNRLVLASALLVSAAAASPLSNLFSKRTKLMTYQMPKPDYSDNLLREVNCQSDPSITPSSANLKKLVDNLSFPNPTVAASYPGQCTNYLDGDGNAAGDAARVSICLIDNGPEGSGASFIADFQVVLDTLKGVADGETCGENANVGGTFPIDANRYIEGKKVEGYILIDRHDMK